MATSQNPTSSNWCEMAIRFEVTTNTAPIDDLVAYAESLQETSNALLEDAVNDVRPYFLSEIQSQPPKRNYPSDYPINWTSDDQRKAYFATNGFRAGIPYRRTGRLAKAWRMVFSVQAGEGRVLVENTSRAARFVYGSLAKNEQAARAFQQRYHRTTGWQFAKETVDFWLEAVIENWQRALDDQFADVIAGRGASGRATTPRLKKRRYGV